MELVYTSNQNRKLANKMSINLFFGVRLNPNAFERIPLTSVNLDNKIEELKSIASQKTNVPSESLGMNLEL